ncbi:response regulator transcription factor [Alicyclobacillus vulcanalis]|uniref:Two component transcriptional regulator, LuxR family n=1 Tax=Alicyclobacillus vulcanalis TaxID=252246 RepID=A0A1N7NZD3_9BACL|nr:response regulator transcription factor [Alicyclobacillus vulcanalis]SIT03646.1 two component transcriptional regulator, LuxR family [Alicyclobacillus vulcanalis]
MIRVLLAEDQGLVSDALATLLTLEGDFDVVAVANDGEEAVVQARAVKPQLALVDIEMPKLSGLEAAERMLRDVPGLGVVLLTTFARPGYLRRALQIGVHGYLLKDGKVEELAAHLRAIVAGQRIFDPALMLAAMETDNPLTPREVDVLRLAREGLSTREMAKRLFLSEGTVRNYLSGALAKLGCDSRHEAIRKADEMGWL